MIRFRIGQSWKREEARPPHDSFGLEVDGVELLPEASEEPLGHVVPALLDTVHALAIRGEPLAHVSLQEAHLELSFRRRGLDVEVQVVSLGRPAQVRRAGVHLDLGELRDAAVKVGRQLFRDLPEAAKNRAMLRRLEALEGAELVPVDRPVPGSGFSYRLAAAHPAAFGFQLWDPDDLILQLSKQGHGALGSLLFAGEVFLGDVALVQAPPFLSALELSRQAVELQQAIDLSERSFSLSPAGAPVQLRVDLEAGELRIDSTVVPVAPLELVRSMFDLGIAFGFALTVRHKAQAKNPYVEELLSRCRDGLSHLRAPVVDPTHRPASAGRARPLNARPLPTPGRLRRLLFQPLWEKQHLGGGDDPGQLLLSPRGPIFTSPVMACALSPKGELLYRRIATRGVAASREGHVVAAFEDRVMGFFGQEASARWVHDHDGLPVGPQMIAKDGLLVVPSEGRAALAFHELTGREAWRAAPPRTQRAFVHVQAHRAVLATDGSALFGMDISDGQMRYKMRSALPFLCPPVAWGRRLVASLGRGSRFAFFAADAQTGKVHVQQELDLAHPSVPLAVGNRLYLAGELGEEGVLLCFGSSGRLAFQRSLHLGRGPFQLLAVGRSVLAVGHAGAATLVSSDGQVQWHLGAAGEPLSARVAPGFARGVLVLAGEEIRAVDPRGGQVLAEVHAGPGLCDLKVDGRLNLYLLDEAGGLKAFRLGSHLAVVGK